MGASTTIPEQTAAGNVQRIPVEELSAHLATLESELSDGRSIEIMRGDAVIAEIVAKKVIPTAQGERVIPDFMGRMKARWGERILDSDGTQIIREDRDARG